MTKKTFIFFYCQAQQLGGSDVPLVRPSLSSSSLYLIGPQIDNFAKLLLKFGQQILYQNLRVVFDGRIRETNLKSEI